MIFDILNKFEAKELTTPELSRHVSFHIVAGEYDFG